MRRRVRDDIEVFSTSFLDLLSCGLAAVVLLWVLLERSAPSEDGAERFAFVSVSQFGELHLATVTVRAVDSGEEKVLPRFKETGDNVHPTVYPSNPSDTVSDTNYKIGQSAAWSEQINALFSDNGRPHVQFSVDDTGRNNFAGSLNLVVFDGCQPGEVELAFRRCGAPDKEHKIYVVLANSDVEESAEFTFDRGTYTGSRTAPEYGTMYLQDILLIRITFGNGDAHIEYSGRPQIDQGAYTP